RGHAPPAGGGAPLPAAIRQRRPRLVLPRRDREQLRERLRADRAGRLPDGRGPGAHRPGFGQVHLPAPGGQLKAFAAAAAAAALVIVGALPALAAPTWAETGQLQVPRAGAAMVKLVDGRVLLIGGDSHGGGTAEVYNPRARRWKRVEDPPPGFINGAQAFLL